MRSPPVGGLPPRRRGRRSVRHPPSSRPLPSAARTRHRRRRLPPGSARRRRLCLRGGSAEGAPLPPLPPRAGRSRSRCRCRALRWRAGSAVAVPLQPSPTICGRRRSLRGRARAAAPPPSSTLRLLRPPPDPVPRGGTSRLGRRLSTDSGRRQPPPWCRPSCATRCGRRRRWKTMITSCAWIPPSSSTADALQAELPFPHSESSWRGGELRWCFSFCWCIDWEGSYEMTTFTFGSHVLHLLCLRAASTDYDLTGQLVWPGAVLMNNYLSEHPETVKGCSIIELGSGIGITGILCSRFCKEVVLTDHNDEVLEIINRNIEMQSCPNAVLTAEKLEWGNHDHISNIVEKYPAGFDVILGADICFQQSSISCLFDTVQKLIQIQAGKCRFILAYVSRAKIMDALILKEAEKHGMCVKEVDGTRTTISNLEGVIFDITLK